MRYVVLALLFSIPCLADESYSTSKRNVFGISCERTFLRIMSDYTIVSKPIQNQAKSIVDICNNLSKAIEKNGEWTKISTPAGQGCREAIRKARGINGKLPEEGDLFLKYCYVIAEMDK